MTTLDSSSAIALMSEYGRLQIPFLFVIDFLAKKPIFLRLDEINPAEMLHHSNGVTNQLTYLQQQKRGVVFHESPISFERYQARFEQVVHPNQKR
jgi:hypothetical protein